MRNKLRISRRWKLRLIGLCLSAVALLCLVRPAVVRYRLAQARRALEERDTQRALVWLDRAQRLDPNRGEISFWRARAFRRLGKVDQVRTHLGRARRLGCPAEAIQREEVLTRAQSGRLPRGDSELAALMLDPGDDSREIYEAAVLGYLETFHLGPALALLHAWEGDHPKDPQPHVYQGMIWSHQKVWADAGASFRKALQLAPRRHDARLLLAGALREQFLYRQALWHYDRCPDEEPQALLGRGICLKALRKEDEARQAFLSLLDKVPDHYEARLALGQLDVFSGGAAEAVGWLEPAAKQKPYEFEVRHALAWALLVAGHKDRAREHFKAAARIQEAMLQVANLQRHADEEPENVELRSRIGKTLLQHGRLSDGLGWLESALQLQPDHRPTHLTLADYYSQQGIPARAAEHRRLADGSD